MFLLIMIIDYFKIVVKELVDMRVFCCKIKDLDIYCILNDSNFFLCYFEVENIEFLVAKIFLNSFMNVYLKLKIVIRDSRNLID